MTDLNALADRVEKLTGPDREVDGQISTYMGVSRQYEGDGVYGCPRYTATKDGEPFTVSEGTSHSPTLALTAAALRARAGADR